MLLHLNTNSERRNLLALQERDAMFSAKINALLEEFLTDWICISDQQITNLTLPPSKARSLIGQEFIHSIFDARLSFNLDAFLILAGTLKKGSVLLLLLPSKPFDRPDLDTLRWNEAENPIATPNFMRHLFDTLNKHQMVVHPIDAMVSLAELLTKLKNDDKLGSLAVNATLLAKPKPTQEQQEVLRRLRQTKSNVVVITAKRGRGKSALAGFFAERTESWVCAANKSCIKILRKFSNPSTVFFPPDELLNKLKKGVTPPKWLIIDEAAMIPLPLLNEIMQFANRLLLLTTTDGYEGTAQGFLLKFIPQLSDVCWLHLSRPIRWLASDPIESMIADLLFETSPLPQLTCSLKKKSLSIYFVPPDERIKNKNQFAEIYNLLKRAHYRTTPSDLRRLLDAQDIDLMVAESDKTIVGAMVSVKEGGITKALSEAIWLGKRRPRGNLVAQSLVAHGGEMLASRMRSLRINRIAVCESARRHDVGRMMVKALIHLANAYCYDFVSVSYGYESSLHGFWQACDFELVQVGSKCDASTGAHSMMAIKALTLSAERTKARLIHKLRRDWFWWQHKIDYAFPIGVSEDILLCKEDWQLLSGFAYASRPYESTYASLCRLYMTLKIRPYTPYPYLLSQLVTINAFNQVGKKSGRKAIIAALREEVGQILRTYGILSPLVPNDKEGYSIT